MAEQRTREKAEARGPEEAYEPPAIAWEEPFDPVAASCCNPASEVCLDPENICPGAG